MGKKEQAELNLFISTRFDKAYDEFMDFMKDNRSIEMQPLYYCNAHIIRLDNYILLKSYNTVVAFIDIKSQEFFDVLRLVYGYTATSAQHIAKFRRKYADYFIKNNIYTWRDI